VASPWRIEMRLSLLRRCASSTKTGEKSIAATSATFARPRQCEGQAAGAAADVEHALAVGEPGKFDEQAASRLLQRPISCS
jgi:hypothetical protein